MPRRAAPPAAATSLPAPPLSPIIQRLRQDWRWAGISQFICTFSEAFALSDWDIEAFEHDLDGTEEAILPDLIAKMLYALTWNRQITRDTAFEHLRKQWLKRDPEGNPFGTLDEPVEWNALGLPQKVEVIWKLCEWQMLEPTRLRSLLKSEDDPTSWRVDPVGWDRHGNTYYLFDDNRLWMQRSRPAPPRPPKKTSRKAKRAERAVKRSKPPVQRSHKKKELAPRSTPPPIGSDEPVSGPRRRAQVQFYGSVTPTVQALKRSSYTETPPKSNRATRSAARGAAQTPQPQQPIGLPPLPRGTRVSRRLRNVDDEWQQIPDEWLKPAKVDSPRNADEESELSELTDEDEHEAQLKATLPGQTNISSQGEQSAQRENSHRYEEGLHAPVVDSAPNMESEEAPGVQSDSGYETDDLESEPPNKVDQDEEADGAISSEVDDVQIANKEEANLPEDFVEWEAVCVSLYDWKRFPEQFSKSRDPNEKAFYKLLVNDVVPQIVDVLTVKEQERLKQEAINNRKRSSRIATRELQREEEQRREQAERDMEERMERLRQEQAAREREEAESMSREQAREARLREREERIAARQAATIARAEAEQLEKDRAERRRERRKRRREGEQVDSSSDEGNSIQPETQPQTPVKSSGSMQDGSNDQSWELRCEVCKLQGWNLNDDADVVCCDDCGRWQHVKCHDRRDIAAGRGLRDWDKVDFKCQDCKQRDIKRQRITPPAELEPPLSSAQPVAPTGIAANGPLLPGPALATTQERSEVPQVSMSQGASDQPPFDEEQNRLLTSDKPVSQQPYSPRNQSTTTSHQSMLQNQPLSPRPPLAAVQQHQPRLSEPQSHQLPHSHVATASQREVDSQHAKQSISIEKDRPRATSCVVGGNDHSSHTIQLQPFRTSSTTFDDAQSQRPPIPGPQHSRRPSNFPHFANGHRSAENTVLAPPSGREDLSPIRPLPPPPDISIPASAKGETVFPIESNSQLAAEGRRDATP